MSSINSDSDCSFDKNWAASKAGVDTVAHTWTIDTFSDYEFNIGQEAHSKMFSSATNVDCKWYLKLRAYDANGYNANTISLYLYLRKSSKVKTIFGIFFKASILIKEGGKTSLKNTQFTQNVTSCVNDEPRSWGWKHFCIKDDYFREKLISNDELTVHIEVVFSTVRDVVINTRNKEMSLKSSAHECNLSENLASLLETQPFADVVLSTNGNEFAAHKVILSARSRVFAAMFLHDTKENQKNRIDIVDVSEEVISEMLRFIYTGKCEKLDELAGDLLAAANKYDLDRLKLLCSKALYKNLSIENVAQCLILADIYNASDLKTEVLRFIVANPTEVFNSVGWKTILSYPMLICEVCRAMAR